MRTSDTRPFTLIKPLVVVAIIAVLASLLPPVLSNTRPLGTWYWGVRD